METHDRLSSDGLVHDKQRLSELQALPLDRKIGITQARIMEWYLHYGGNIYVSFSGGKDSTVLLHIARQLFPDIPAVYVDTGLEFPEVKRFIRSFDHVNIIRPKMTFPEVISFYGYPLIRKEVAEAIYYARRHDYGERERERERERPQKRKNKIITGTLTKDGATHRAESPALPRLEPGSSRSYAVSGMGGGTGSNSQQEMSQFNKEKWLPLAQNLPVKISHYCCTEMKKKPSKSFSHQNKAYPILATMASESRIRKQSWIRNGCNAFDASDPKSQPMAFWTEQDVLEYIRTFHLEIPSVYGEIIQVDYKGRNVEESGCKACRYKTTGCARTGCVYCAFGLQAERGETRFQKLSKTHPKLYDYCISGGQWVDNPDYDPLLPKDLPITVDIGWNPKKIWVPSKSGLGMGKVFDLCNEIYGENILRYQ